jgi:hypothetical protein
MKRLTNILTIAGGLLCLFCASRTLAQTGDVQGFGPNATGQLEDDILIDTQLGITAPAKVSLDANHCQTYGGGQGWSWTIVDNLDVTGDNAKEFVVDFFHYSIGRLIARLPHERSIYDRRNNAAALTGVGLFNSRPVVVMAEVHENGGSRGSGITYLNIYSDFNSNGKVDSGETLVRSLRLSAIFTDLYFDPKTKQR